jgi:hypothetical protein
MVGLIGRGLLGAAAGAVGAKAMTPTVKPATAATTALQKATTQQKSQPAFTRTEQSILGQHGINRQGFWYGQEGKSVSRDKMQDTLQGSIYTSILEKISIVDTKVTRLTEIFTKFISKYNMDRLEDQLEKVPKGFNKVEGEKREEKPKASFLGAMLDVLRLFLPGMLAGLFLGLGKDLQNAIGVLVNRLFADSFLGIKVMMGRITKDLSAGFDKLKGKLGFQTEAQRAAMNDAKYMRDAKGNLVSKTTGRSLGGAARVAAEAHEAKNVATGVGKAITAVSQSGIGKVVKKVSSKMLMILERLTAFRTILRMAPALSVILAFLDPLIAFIDAGFEVTPEVKTSFRKALGGFIGGTGGAILGGLLGSVIPIFGTLIGAVAGGMFGSYFGEWVAGEMYSYFVEGKSIEQIMVAFKDKSIEKITQAGSAIMNFGKSVASFVTGNGWTSGADGTTKNGVPGVSPGDKNTPSGTGKNPPNNQYDSNKIKGFKQTGSSKEAMDFFISKGWTKKQSAGIVGNLMAESTTSLRTDIVGDAGQAYGIAQWHPDRQAIFKREFKKDIRESTFKEQLEFVNWELHNNERDAGRALKQATSVTEAAVIIDKKYERSAGDATQKRVSYAVSLLGNDVSSGDKREVTINPAAPTNTIPPTPTVGGRGQLAAGYRTKPPNMRRPSTPNAPPKTPKPPRVPAYASAAPHDQLAMTNMFMGQPQPAFYTGVG